MVSGVGCRVSGVSAQRDRSNDPGLRTLVLGPETLVPAILGAMLEDGGLAARPVAGWLAASEQAAGGPAEGRPFWSSLNRALDPGAACPRRSPLVEVRSFSSQRAGASHVLKNALARTY